MLLHALQFSQDFIHLLLIFRPQIPPIILHPLPCKSHLIINNSPLTLFNNSLLLKYVPDQISIILLIKQPDIFSGPLRLHSFKPFFENIRPHLLNHDFKMNGLFIQFLVDILVFPQFHLLNIFYLVKFLQVLLLSGKIFI